MSDQTKSGKKISRFLLLTALALLSGPLSAETISAYVVSVRDGESLLLADVNRQQIKVRLLGVAAPRRTQSFGEASRTHLANLTLNKNVRFESTQRKQGDILVGKLLVQPPDCRTCEPTLDVGIAQIASGMAWFAKPAANDVPSEDRARYEHAEFEAKIRRTGLWQDKNPLPPWQWPSQ